MKTTNAFEKHSSKLVNNKNELTAPTTMIELVCVKIGFTVLNRCKNSVKIKKWGALIVNLLLVLFMKHLY